MANLIIIFMTLNLVLLHNINSYNYYKLLYLPWVNVNPTNGKCKPANAEFAVGGTTSEFLISESSTSKFDVSVGLETSGI